MVREKDLTQKQISTIYRMKDRGHSVKHISIGTRLNSDIIYKYLRFRKARIHSELGYNNYLARKRGFENHGEYKNFLAVFAGFNSSRERQTGFGKRKQAQIDFEEGFENINLPEDMDFAGDYFSERRELISIVRKAFWKFEENHPEDARFIVQRFFEEDSPTEIAQREGITCEAARIRETYALRRFRPYLLSEGVRDYF